MLLAEAGAHDQRRLKEEIVPDFKEIIATPAAPEHHLPLSQAVKANGFVFCSGFVGDDPKTGRLVGADIESQTEQTLANLKAVLEAAGSSMERVVKATVFLSDVRDFGGMNTVFARYFPSNPPARSTVGVSLMIDAKIEIELVAIA